MLKKHISSQSDKWHLASFCVLHKWDVNISSPAGLVFRGITVPEKKIYNYKKKYNLNKNNYRTKEKWNIRTRFGGIVKWNNLLIKIWLVYEKKKTKKKLKNLKKKMKIYHIYYFDLIIINKYKYKYNPHELLINKWTRYYIVGSTKCI